MESCIENVFEFLKTDDTVTATVSKKKFVNKLKRLSDKYPDIFIKTAENVDGSIVVKFPLKYLRIGSPRSTAEECISEE